jgi:hypothetical protein
MPWRDLLSSAQRIQLRTAEIALATAPVEEASGFPALTSQMYKSCMYMARSLRNEVGHSHLHMFTKDLGCFVAQRCRFCGLANTATCPVKRRVLLIQ